MKKLLTLLLLSPLAFAEEETFICNCDTYTGNDFIVKSCNEYPKGLIINSVEETFSFKDRTHYYKSNPNTLSSRGYEARKNADDFVDKETVIEIEFEKVTNMLTWNRTDTYWVQDANTKGLELTNQNSITEYFICESTK